MEINRLETNRLETKLKKFRWYHPNGQIAAALCPFHYEKTPSFNMNFKKGIFKCFGCGKSGSIEWLERWLEATDAR